MNQESEQHTPKDVRTVLIVLMGSLGDVVRSFALVSPLKQHFKGCTITWLVEPKCEGIVSMNSSIDRVVVFNRKRGVAALPRLLRALREQRYDLVLDLQRHFKSGFFSLLSGGARRIGFHRKDSKEGNWLFQSATIPERGDQLPKLEHYLTFLDYLGIQRPAQLDFGLESVLARTDVQELLRELPRRYIAVVLGSSWESKDWSLEGYQRLMTRLTEHSERLLVLLGDASQKERASRLMQSAPAGRVINLVQKTSLAQLVGVVGAASLCVGPDSGPGHIAGALGIPYVSLFGPTSPLRTAPYGSEHLVLRSQVPCAPCYRRKCPGLGKICMRLISPDQVVEQIQGVEQSLVTLSGNSFRS